MRLSDKILLLNPDLMSLQHQPLGAYESGDSLAVQPVILPATSLLETEVFPAVVDKSRPSLQSPQTYDTGY